MASADRNELGAQIREGLQQVSADRLIPAPDCGMKYLTRAVAYGKLVALAAAAAKIRDELG